MTAATFTGMGRGKAGSEEQFRDALGEGTKEEFPLVLEDAEQPKKGKPGTSKSKGKQLGDQPAQAAEGAEAPPEETPLDPNPTGPHTDPAPIDPQPGTSKASTRLPLEIPPRLPLKAPPRLLPKTLMKTNPQLLLSMSWSTKQQAKLG